MAKRRKLPRLSICKIRPERFRRMDADQLMRVWSRLGASAPSRTKANSLVKGIVSNLAAAKSSRETYKNDPVQRRRSMEVYMFIVRRLERELKKEQAKACKTR